MVEIGGHVGDFTLEGVAGGEIREFSLSDVLTDRPAVIVFYIYDYSPVCSTQMCEVNDMELLTFNNDVAVFGISTDGPYSHREFASDNDLSYPLLTDEDKQVYEQFGMIEETEEGTRKTKRGIAVVDSDGILRYRWVARDNWDEWVIQPLSDANDVVRKLLAE